VRVPKILIQAFIVFHILAITLHAFPGTSEVRQKLQAPFNGYIRCLGLWQSWAMFSPNPSNSNAMVRAEILYQNGSVQFWDLPRMMNLSIRDKYVFERYRKWAVDNIRLDDHEVYWPDSASFIARKANDDPNNPPIKVTLWRLWKDIEDPEIHFRKVGFRVPESELHRHPFYSTSIKPEDLR